MHARRTSSAQKSKFEMMRWSLALISIPLLIYLHLLVSPYTKVEESFNIQAVHDILTYGIPAKDVGPTLKARYDHMTFPGAVPRTFIGALVLAGFSRPVIWFNQALDRQHLGELGRQELAEHEIYDPLFQMSSLTTCPVRGILGLFNAMSLLTYAIGVRTAFGTTAGLWYIALQASQFHIIYYASRTLPNMFAFGISAY